MPAATMTTTSKATAPKSRKAIPHVPIKTTSPTQQPNVFPFFRLPRELRDVVYDLSLTFKHKLPAQHHIRLRLRRAPAPRLQLISHQFRHEYLSRAEFHTTLVVVDRDEYLGENLSIPKPLLPWLRNVEIHLALACNEACHAQPHYYGHTHNFSHPPPVFHLTSIHHHPHTTSASTSSNPSNPTTNSQPTPPLLPSPPALHQLAQATSQTGCRIRKELRMHARWIADLTSRLSALTKLKIQIVLDPHVDVAGCEALLIEDQYRLTNLKSLSELRVFYCEYESRPEARWNFSKPRREALRWVGGCGSSGRLQRGDGSQPKRCSVVEEVVSDVGEISSSGTVSVSSREGEEQGQQLDQVEEAEIARVERGGDEDEWVEDATSVRENEEISLTTEADTKES